MRARISADAQKAARTETGPFIFQGQHSAKARARARRQLVFDGAAFTEKVGTSWSSTQGGCSSQPTAEGLPVSWNSSAQPSHNNSWRFAVAPVKEISWL